ncbi:MAG: Nicotine blue oxidoreductase [Gemmatimonadaceae bacterium]|nr:Nicotine blue oxidoreductase [Gemmatimonadaceae bacterium]
MISAIVLAAGRATRFGTSKIVAPLWGTPLVRHVVDRLQRAGIDEAVVVAGEASEAIAHAVQGTGARVVVNRDPATGLSGSLRVGLRSVSPDADAILVALGDQPLIDASVVDGMIAAWRSLRGTIVVPVYNGERGNPVLFDRSLRPVLEALEGDRGARDLLADHGGAVYRFRVQAAAPKDVDTVDDLAGLERSVGAG